MVYWAAATCLLWRQYGPIWDGFGPSSSFHWSCSTPPSPLPNEYYGDFGVRWQFYREYLNVAAGLTAFGFLAARRAAHPRSALGWGIAAVWIAMGVSIVGSYTGLWCGPMKPFDDVYTFVLFTWTTIIFGLLTALWVIARDRYLACAGPRKTALTNSTFSPSR